MSKVATRQLASWGAPEDLCQLIDSSIRKELQLNKSIYSAIRSKTEEELHDEQELEEQAKISQLLKDLKETRQHFSEALDEVNKLCVQASSVTPWKEPKWNGTTSITALCDMKTKQIEVTRGDQLSVIPNGKPNLVRVRTARNGEDNLPLLSCAVPLPDRTPQGLSKRLHVHLASAWVSTLKKHRSAILELVANLAEELANNDIKDEATDNSEEAGLERRLALLDKVLSGQKRAASLHKVHEALWCIMLALGEKSKGKLDIYQKIDDIDKLVLYYQGLLKQWQQYRRSLREADVPLQIVDSLRHFKPSSKGCRVYEVTITVDEVETEETITHVQSEEWQSTVSSRKEQVETDKITAARSEQSQKFVIKAVLDRRTEEEISLDDAIQEGIVNPKTGMYHDLTTGESYPIPVAMNAGFIIVESSTTQRTKEETKEFGLVTIKTLNDKRPYNIQQVVDPLTGEKLSTDTAIERKILDQENAVYRNTTTGDTIPVSEAIQTGWIIVEFEESEEPEFLTKTYAIRAVVNQKTKDTVSFHKAVQLGILEKDTGTYIHGETGEHIYVGDAISRGFLKATEVKENEMNISEENKIVVEKMSRIKQKLFKPMGVLSALKKAAK